MTSVTARSSELIIGAPTPPSGPNPRASKAVQIKPKPNDSMAPGTLLPEIRTSENSMDKRQPLPTSLQADFIPEDILMALVVPPAPHETLGPMSRNRNLNVSMMPKRRPPASVWGHPQQREKLKYLTENPPCVCGAGRDISFLYDVPKKPENKKVDMNDQSAIRVQEENEPRKAIQLPDTLIPGEYHVVKNKGVLGLEYTDDKFAAQPKDHEKHLVMFPSLNPSSRAEVKQLKKTMTEMMERLGINDLASELRGPTQMHNLIELIKKEQNIYNLVFHELIRQVSVECMDRGELLAALRDQYSQLLNRVPLQIKALHEEVMAQRALDRRLTEELMRFKSTIGILTSELADVKEHDIEVTAQANQAQEDLKNALAESQKNASLLAEYHGLYELQRKRLEKQVFMLAEEKDLWSTAAYSLALKVTEEHSLNTAKRLHINEKGWVKLANHFTILLSDKDTEMLTQLQGYVDNWRDLVDEFNLNIKQREDEMKQSLLNVQSAIKGWIQDFQKHVLNKDGQVNRGPDRDKAARLYNDIKGWGQLLNQESEKFGGDTLLGGQESLMRIRRLVEGWTDCSLKVFTRHRGEDGSNYPDHDEMLKMNELVDDLMSQYYVRLTGENGVATALISVTNGLDAWDNKLNALMHGSNPLPDQEWGRFYALMDDWVEAINHAMSLVGTTQKEEDRHERRTHIRIELSQVMKMTQKWLSSTTNGIDSEDAKLVEQVSTLHTEMVKWMVQLLLRLAPDRPSHSQEAKDAVLEGTPTVAQLVANAKSLFDRLAGFSKYVAFCCNGIVMDMMQQKVDRHEEDADHEYRDLQRLKNECDDWIATAKLLLMELTGEPFPETPTVSAMGLVPPTPGEKQDTELTDKSALEGQLDAPDSAMESADGEEKEPDTARTEEAPTEPEPEPQPEQEPEKPAAAPADSQADAAAAEPAQQPSDEVAPPLVDEADEAADAPAETAPAPEPEPEPEDPNKMQVIGHDANTRSKTLQEQPKAEAPIDQKPPTTPGTPDPKKAFEAIAALDTIQAQLIATEERAQTAEERAAIAEADLKRALETIKALERKVVVTPSESEAAERSESVATQASKPTEEAAAEKPDKKATKDKDKDKDKDKRSSSKASNKSSKKK